MRGQHAGVKIKDLGLTLSVVVAVGLSAEVTQDQHCEGRMEGAESRPKVGTRQADSCCCHTEEEVFTGCNVCSAGDGAKTFCGLTQIPNWLLKDFFHHYEDIYKAKDTLANPHTQTANHEHTNRWLSPGTLMVFKGIVWLI